VKARSFLMLGNRWSQPSTPSMRKNNIGLRSKLSFANCSRLTPAAIVIVDRRSLTLENNHRGALTIRA
jgi:hypothetical protein